MGKIIKAFSIGFMIIFYLSACTTNSSEPDSSETSSEQLSLRIVELNEKIVTLQEQVNSLTDRVNKPEIIVPIVYNDELLYINDLMPLVMSIPSDIDLPIKVYRYYSTILIYFENEDVKQFIESYNLTPSIIVKENNNNPDLNDKKNIVKIVDEDLVIIKNMSIETSLDEQTNLEIQAMLKNIKFY